MGNDGSKDKQDESTLQMFLDKTKYYQEEACTGRVVVDIAFPIILNDIHLDLNVKEFWRYVIRVEDHEYSETFDKTVLTYELNVRKFLKINTPEINLPPGQYTLPFSFIIPKHAQPSFKHLSRKYFSSIHYTLVAKVISDYVKYSKSTNLTILSIPVVLDEPLKFSTCVNIHSWLLFGQGSVIFNAQYPTNNYRMLDVIPLTIFVDNTRGKIKTQSIKLKLKRKLIFSRPNSKKSFKFEFEIHKETIAFVTNPNDKNTIEIRFPIIDCSEYNKNVSADEKKERLSQLSSVNGTVVQCEYYIKAKLYFEKFVTSNYLPKIYMPIAISHQTMNQSYLERKENNELNQAIFQSKMEEEQNKYNQINNNNNLVNSQGENNNAPQPASMMHNQNNLNQSAPIHNQQNISNFEPMQSQPLTPNVVSDMNHNYNNNNMNFNSQGTNYYQNANQTEEPLDKNLYPQFD